MTMLHDNDPDVPPPCIVCHGLGYYENPALWDGRAECSHCEGTGEEPPDEEEDQMPDDKLEAVLDKLEDYVCALVDLRVADPTDMGPLPFAYLRDVQKTKAKLVEALKDWKDA